MKAPTSLAAVERYEALRQNAVALVRERILSAEPLGAILVVQRGVAGWMHRWNEAAGTTARPAAALSGPTGWNEPGWQQELTLLLAQMSIRQLSVSDSQS